MTIRSLSGRGVAGGHVNPRPYTSLAEQKEPRPTSLNSQPIPAPPYLYIMSSDELKAFEQEVSDLEKSWKVLPPTLFL